MAKSGQAEQLYASTSSTELTAVVNTSKRSKLRRIALFLGLTITLSLCSIVSASVPIGNTLTAEAIDYSKPVQYVPVSFNRSIRGSVVSDWRESTVVIPLESDYDPNSFTLTVYAVDNYGQNFETWVSVYPDVATNNPRFNSGWSSVPIQNEPIIMNTGLTEITLVIRFRYPTGVGTNPPTTSDFGYCKYSLNYYVAQNYEPAQTTAIPPDWTVNTTVTATGFPDYPTVTSTYSTDDIPGDISTYNPFSIDTVLSSWTSFSSVLLSLHTALPWVSLLIGFVCLCSIIWWLLR